MMLTFERLEAKRKPAGIDKTKIFALMVTQPRHTALLATARAASKRNADRGHWSVSAAAVINQALDVYMPRLIDELVREGHLPEGTVWPANTIVNGTEKRGR